MSATCSTSSTPEDGPSHRLNERRRPRETRRLAEEAQAKAGDTVAQPEGKKIVDYNEHGHAIYEDGTTSADEDKAKQRPKRRPKPRTVASPIQQIQHPADVDEGEPTVDQWEESLAHTATPSPTPAIGGWMSRSRRQAPWHTRARDEFALKPTDNSGGGYNEPYRLYNLDVFEYDLDVPMALYGAIPPMVAHSAKRTVAAFWFNPTETSSMSMLPSCTRRQAQQRQL